MRYAEYLQLDRLLDAQAMVSMALQEPILDEHFFIVLHQSHELWFKQILVDARAILDVPPEETSFFEHALPWVARMNAVQRHIVGHMDLLPMLDADAFLRLRGLLAPASGSQSLQFRLIEAMLGTGRGATAESVMDQFDDAEQRRFRDVLSRPSLHDVIAQALQHQWQRWHGRAGVHEKAQRWNALLDDEDSTLHTGKSGADFKAASVGRHEPSGEALPRSCTLMALLAVNADSGLAAMRDCLLALVAFEDLLLCWRERHAQAVHALLDNLPGTGGTSGYRYLRAAMAALPRSALHTLLKLTAPRLGLLPSSGTAVSAA